MIYYRLLNIARKLFPLRVLKIISQWHYSIMNLYRYGYPDFFYNLEVEISTACNRRCTYCPNSKFDKGLLKNMKKMDIELFKKIVNELSELKFIGRFHYHFYNEPLLDSRLVLLVQYVKTKCPKIRSVIVSNGEYLTVDMYKKLVQAGATEFFITEHSQKSFNNVRDILEYRKNAENDSAEFNSRKLEMLCNRGGLVEIEKKKRWKIKQCSRPSRCLQIDYEGNVILCCNDYFSTVKFGNVKNEKLINIWNKREFKQLRKDIKNNIYNLEICKKCTS